MQVIAPVLVGKITIMLVLMNETSLVTRVVTVILTAIVRTLTVMAVIYCRPV